MRNLSTLAPLVCASLAALSGCAGSPAAPFDTLKTSNLTAYRLQNYDATPAAAATPGAPAAVPGLPPEIQSWISAGAAGLQQLIPPNLLPPGLIPGAPGAAATPAADTTPRFHEFRILSQTQVLDADLKDQLGKLLGNKDSFDQADARCAPNVFYAEMGLSFSSNPAQPPNDVLVSFSCNQIVSRSFSWPHPATGMKPDTVKQMSQIVQKLWPQGT